MRLQAEISPYRAKHWLARNDHDCLLNRTPCYVIWTDFEVDGRELAVTPDISETRDGPSRDAEERLLRWERIVLFRRRWIVSAVLFYQ